MPTLHPLFYSILAALLTFLATWYWKRVDAKAKAIEADQAATKALKEALATETRERVQWQLQNQGDLAKIADILEESTEAQKLLASIAARVDSHDGHIGRHDNELLRLRDRLEKMQDHVSEFALSRVKPS